MAACLLVMICTGRVLSPQYLAWFLPLVVIAEQDWDPAWLLVGAATTLVFPFAYRLVHPVGSGPPPEFPLPPLVALPLRHALLVPATVRSLGRPGMPPRPRPRRPPEPPVRRAAAPGPVSPQPAAGQLDQQDRHRHVDHAVQRIDHVVLAQVDDREPDA